MRRARWLALGVLVSGEGPSSLLELTEANFDVLLREVPVALVAYVNPTTDLHYPRLRPNLLALADAYAHAGIGVGTVSSQWAELLDRFNIDAFPTLHWMDGSKKWPYYASEATPVRYEGARSYEAMARFVQWKTNIKPKGAEEKSAPKPKETPAADETPTASDAVLAAVEDHDCTEPSAVYRACLARSPASWQKQMCASERHDYLLCMSGKWAVHPDHHQELAQIYGRQFARPQE